MRTATTKRGSFRRAYLTMIGVVLSLVAFSVIFGPPLVDFFKN